jgi:hypothetical protein
MAFLFFDTRVKGFDLPVEEFKRIVAKELQHSGFTDVVHTPGEVAGNRAGGVRLSVSYFVNGENFWQVVVAAGDAADVTRKAIDDGLNAIKSIKLL